MSDRFERAGIALGSNLGDRQVHLQAAVRGLREAEWIAVRRCSAIYETEAVSPIEQGPYLNAVVLIETERSAEDLLEVCLGLERDAGRERAGVRDAPRTLDLDLLFFGSRVSRDATLTLPHPRLHERPFVLVPLCEVAPDWQHPLEGASAAQLLRRFGEVSGVRRWGNLEDSGVPKS